LKRIRKNLVAARQPFFASLSAQDRRAEMTDKGRGQAFDFGGLGRTARLSPVLLGILGVLFTIIAAPPL
jgi:hypothetical protein